MMPITPERKKKYPKDWKKIRARIIERAGDCCELCGVINGKYVARPKSGRGGFLSLTPDLYDWDQFGFKQDYKKPVKIVLTVHHINNDPTDNRDYNLLALCQRCHLKLDQPFKIKAKADAGEVVE